MKLSPMGKCPIKHTNLFIFNVVAIINVVDDLMSKLKSSQRMARFAFKPYGL